MPQSTIYALLPWYRLSALWRDSQWSGSVGQWTYAVHAFFCFRKMRPNTQNEDVNRPEKCRTYCIALHRRDNIFDNKIETEKISFQSMRFISSSASNWNDCIIVELWVVTLIERGDHCAFHTSHRTCIQLYALFLCGSRSTISSTHQRLASPHIYNGRGT